MNRWTHERTNERTLTLFLLFSQLVTTVTVDTRSTLNDTTYLFVCCCCVFARRRSSISRRRVSHQPRACMRCLCNIRIVFTREVTLKHLVYIDNLSRYNIHKKPPYFNMTQTEVVSILIISFGENEHSPVEISFVFVLIDPNRDLDSGRT